MTIANHRWLDSHCLALAKCLADEFAQTAIERDSLGGTPKKERDQLRTSGLLKLIIPLEFGGWGQTWQTVFAISRILGQVDSSLAHVFSYHHLGVVIPEIFGTPEQAAYYYSETIQRNWFWCNALNPRDRRLLLIPDGQGYRLQGIKSYCSGSHDSDIIPITAVHSESGILTVVIIPTDREGVFLHHDWNNMGQRQTDSGSVEFEQVKVKPEEVIGNRSDSTIAFKTIRACLSQLNLANIYLGIAEGAFLQAKNFILKTDRPTHNVGKKNITEDPYLLQHFGELYVSLESANALVEKAGNLLQAAWDQKSLLSFTDRGECSIAIATAKVSATKVGLEVTSRIFDLMGARATDRKYGFDRYWRNLRTFTLHDSLDYKIKAIGDFALNDHLPQPDFYI